MPTDGATVLTALDRALSDALAAVRAAEDQAAALDQQLDTLVADRGKALVELARHYLPTITQHSIDATFAEVRDDLQNIVTRKQRQERKLQEQIAALTESREQLHAELRDCTRELNEFVRRRETAEESLAAGLNADSTFQKLSGELTQARFQLEANERRLAEIHAEASEKLPAYENSQLFQYLHDRQFAEPAYRHRGLTRRLDRWIAGLIDYDRARQSYRFLHMTPQLADAEVRRRRDELAKLESQVAKIEEDASQVCGLPDIVARGQQLGGIRDELLDKLDDNSKLLEPLEAAYAELAESQGSFYDEAIVRFKQFLEQAHTALLEQRASATPDTTDDEIVAQISWLDQQIEQQKQEAPRCRKRRRDAEQAARGLRYVTRRCRRSNIDSKRCYFEDGFDIARLIDRFRDSEIDEHKLLRSIRDHVRFHPTWAEETGKQIGNALEHSAAQGVVGAVTAVAAESLRRVVKRHAGGFTRDEGF